jgi:outer membrane receptor protein involved in Fe transport
MVVLHTGQDARRDRGAVMRASQRRLAICCAVIGAAVVAPGRAADLDALSMEQLMQIEVVGASKYEQKQDEVAAAVSVITRQEIKAFGWRTLDEALASLPGVYTTYDRQYSYLGMRGFGLPGDYNSRVLITIDGNRVNDPTFDTGPVGRDFPLDMDLVERIEFIPGPGGAVYGQNAMLGVVNVITRNGAGLDGGELQASYKEPQAEHEERGSVGTRLDNGVDVLLSVSDMRARGQNLFFDYGATGLSGVAAGMDGERNTQYLIRVERGPWSFESVNGDHLKDDPTAALLADPFVPGTYQGDAYALNQVRYQDSFAQDKLHISVRLFTGTERFRSRESYDGDPSALPADSEWRGGEVSLLSTAWTDHKVLVGVEAQDNIRENQAALDLANPANDIFIDLKGYRAGLFTQDEWHVNDSFAATAGVRVDRDNVATYQSSPRAALIWHIASASTVKLLYGRAHRSPNAFERDYGDGYSEVANPTLRGETMDTIELAFDHRVNGDLAVHTSVYQWKMRDLITLGVDPVSGLAQYQTGKPALARGIEQSASQIWDSGARLRGSLSLQDVTYVNGGPLLNSPKLLTKLNLSAPLQGKALRVAYEFQYDSRRLSLDGMQLGGYPLSNLILSTDTMVRGLDASLAVLNAFGKRYSQPGGPANWQNAFAQDGRSLRLTLSQRF